MNTPFQDWLHRSPLIAILRGIRPEEVLDVGGILVESGFCLIEVPLNSPEPFESIARLVQAFGDRVLVGAGTVLNPDQVEKIAVAGGRLVVMPHADARVVQAARERRMFVVPGFSTPTEAFRMIEAGADALKLFPAEAHPPGVLRALRAVLPKDMPVLPVGGITSQNMAQYWEAGANGFGLGSALYKAGKATSLVGESAREFHAALEKLPQR
ncbi:MAG: 2-dehydro-3-deoxy-6-phosphogalactonate aldolase [Burkholderiales bacterium]